jgi:hypothetical protein
LKIKRKDTDLKYRLLLVPISPDAKEVPKNQPILILKDNKRIAHRPYIRDSG